MCACAPPRFVPEPGVLTVSQEQQGSFVRNFHPFLPPGTARWPTAFGVYEPLLIYNPLTGEYVPWLATDFSWGEGARSVSMTVREGVRWSDGSDFSADDVLFTFELLLSRPGLDLGGLTQFLDRVERDGNTVLFTFKKPYLPGLIQLAHTPIVPRHIWATIEEPVTFANPEPVGTGPFTEVLSFDNQVFVLGANPHYWQPGKPAVRALRMPAFPTNEQATLALINGEVDWAGNFVPAIDRVFVARDPEHHGYWFPAVSGSIYLYPSQKREVLRDARVRKAISLAIDRKLVNRVAMYDYTAPAEPAGLTDGYAKWRHPSIGPTDGWVHLDPAEAGRLLDAAGLSNRDRNGMRLGPDGKPVVLELLVIAGWSDWVRACQVMARNLRDLGLDARVKALDFSGWFERVQRGDFDLSMGWAADGPTVHGLFQGLMSNATVKPLGESTFVNWHRYGNTEADALLAELERTVDEAEQKRIAHRLQEIFIEEAPAIPIFQNPSWGEYNSKRFTGWPGPHDPYARLSPNHPAEPLLVMTRLEPTGWDGTTEAAP